MNLLIIPTNNFKMIIREKFGMNLTIMSEDNITTLINTLKKIDMSQIKDDKVKKNILREILTELSEKPLPDNMNDVMNDGMNDGMFNNEFPSDKYKNLFNDLKNTAMDLLASDQFRTNGGKSHHRKKRKSRSKSRKRSKSRGKSKRK